MQSFPLLAGLRLLLVALHLIYGAVLVALLFRLGGVPWRQRLKRIWSRQLLMLLGIQVESDESDVFRIDSGLLVGNHISFIDIFVINALLPSGFVAKSEVAQWPLIGWLCRHNDTVFIERGSRKAAHRTHQHMLRMLGAGLRLAIFPEGTSTAGDTLLPFHAALFQSAIDAAVPVHALALSYHRADGTRSEAPAYIDDISLLDCLMTVLRAGGLTARVTLAASFAPPLPNRRHLAHRAHQAVATALERAHGAAQALPLIDFNPEKREVNRAEGTAQPLRNEAAIKT
ncbi:MAG: 1-acyl-sn-glycerol-3-phosphate acyltransferase [Sulfuritalea sp.]|jgi:1-acyl-sn-glycerol-3-phosphate acyltransferase|nr:1-acyl-sn-glycerol-3-phosphate acyltransferase [Sulfuritalea sp.]